MKKSTIIEICICVIVVIFFGWIFYKSVVNLDDNLTTYYDPIDEEIGTSNEEEKVNSEKIITNTIENVNSERINSNSIETNEIEY